MSVSPPPATRSAPFYVDAPYTALASIKPNPNTPNQVWYFEGVSNTPSSSRASIQIIFMAGAPLGAMPVPLPFLVLVTGTDHDGTYFETALPAVGGADVMPGKGVWKLPGTAEASWERDRDDERWTVKFGGFAGSEGVLTLKTAVPLNVAHYPTERHDQVLFDHELPEPLLPGGGIGWSTSVPGAEVSFEGTVSGKTVKFTGSGFHDTNFATSQWPNHFAQWYWARGTVGTYTFVVYRFLAVDKSSWHTSAAVWKDGKTQTNIWTGSPDWTDDSVEVSHVGIWPDVPQKLEEPAASELGLRIRIRTATFEVTSTKIVAKGSKLPYGRWIATVKVVDEATLQEAVGSGSFDWFVFQ